MEETLVETGVRRDASGQVQISPGLKDVKHVFIFFQQARRLKSLTQNPYFFDTFDLDGDDSAKLKNCRLQYGSAFYPETNYEAEDQIQIRRDLINYRYRTNDYNTGTQLDAANYTKLYPVIHFDLRPAKESVTGDPKKLVLHYQLNEAANAHDNKIFAATLKEKEFVLKEIENELVTV